ncbi:MAG: ATP-binding protein, partial [Spirochaetes bacterium]|nr:ATP-binding protein [Spirochaetota bacterium]
GQVCCRIAVISDLANKALQSDNNTIIIDEIQRVPELTIAVKYAIDNQNTRFIMTGSSSIGLLDSMADTLAGRIFIYSMPTACFGEAAGSADHNFFNEEIIPPNLDKASRLLDSSITFGQFPEIVIQNDDAGKMEILKNYRNTYFTRDLMQFSNIENLEGLLAIFNNLARSLGSHLEISNFARESGLSHITTKKYLNTLLQSQLTFKLYGYHYGPAKRYIKAAKTYFCDNGIIQSLNASLSEGQLFENFVISELEKRRKLGFIKTDQFYYMKTVGGMEIDLVFETDDSFYAVEIKSSTKLRSRDLHNLKSLKGKMHKPVNLYLINRGNEYQVIDGVRIIPSSALFRGI